MALYLSWWLRIDGTCIGIVSLFCPYRVRRLQDPVKPPDPDRPHYTCLVWWWVCHDDTHSPHILLHHSYRWETLLTASHQPLTYSLKKGLTTTHCHHRHSFMNWLLTHHSQHLIIHTGERMAPNHSQEFTVFTLSHSTHREETHYKASPLFNYSQGCIWSPTVASLIHT